MRYPYYAFFAGGGMSGLGLGDAWRCAFANDVVALKAASYRANHGGGGELVLKDVALVSIDEVPGQADLAWASFPCQDLSLAGKGAGLAGERSGAFRPFWGLIEALHGAGRGSRLVVVENVCGAITNNGGRDFATLAASFADLGYRVGAVVADAVHFLPQSRPRLFIVGVRDDVSIPAGAVQSAPSSVWHPPALVEGYSLLSAAVQSRWIWWRLAMPMVRRRALSDLIEDDHPGMAWHSVADTQRLLGMMSPVNRRKVEAAQQLGTRVVGTIYRRTRPEADGTRRQRAEVRFDGIAGCLRTPAGGSSRQTLIIVDGEDIRSRLLSPREAASLMGLPRDYVLPARCTDAYKLVGDGVAVPVVRHLAASIFEPVLRSNALRLVA